MKPWARKLFKFSSPSIGNTLQIPKLSLILHHTPLIRAQKPQLFKT